MSWSKEDKLLLLCCQGNKARKRIEPILRQEINWDDVLYSDISPLAYYNLKEMGLGDLIPSEVWERLEKIYLSSTARNIVALKQLGDVLKTFNKKNIPVIILKGAMLQETVYPSVGLRAIADLDILIHKANLEKAKEELSGLGYSFCKTHADNHITFRKKGKISAPIELHWDLIGNVSPLQKYAFKFDLDKFWKRAIEIEIDGVKTLGMCPEDLLIYFSAHMLKESYTSLKWFADINEVINTYNIDWDNLVAEAHNCKLGKLLYYTLTYVHQLLDASIPSQVLERLCPSKISWIESKMFNRVLEGKPIENWHRIFLYFFIIGSFGQRIKALFNLITYVPKKIYWERFNTAPDFHGDAPL